MCVCVCTECVCVCVSGASDSVECPAMKPDHGLLSDWKAFWREGTERSGRVLSVNRVLCKHA